MSQDTLNNDFSAIGSLMDALTWLESQVSIESVKRSSSDPGQYILNPEFSVSHFIFHLEGPDLFLAIRDSGTPNNWFVDMPWKMIWAGKTNNSAAILFVSEQIKFPEFPEINFSGGLIPELKIKLFLHSSFLQDLESRTVRVGSFKINEDQTVLLVKQSDRAIPISMIKQNIA